MKRTIATVLTAVALMAPGTLSSQQSHWCQHCDIESMDCSLWGLPIQTWQFCGSFKFGDTSTVCINYYTRQRYCYDVPQNLRTEKTSDPKDPGDCEDGDECTAQ
ncbi:MAG: hypothetical protein JSS66_16015 [Armatimonadetes bacterium]|nr:hypothetical protein [Armatimonadota bacterium]